LRWEVPRELLWAIIFGLAITVVALWPLQYPYGQAPENNPQEQTENSVGRDRFAREAPSSPINTAHKQQAEPRRDDTPEVTFLGIKPGEWLLGVVTWMLWWATVRLVTEGKRASDQIIKETRRIGEAQTRAYVSVTAANIEYVFNANTPLVSFVPHNSGQSPAQNFLWNIIFQYPAPEINREVSFNPNWLHETGISIPANSAAPPESAIVPDMNAKQDIEPKRLPSTVVRAKIEFRFTDVFDQDWFGEAYFAGLIEKNVDRWSGSLSPMPKPRDWDRVRKV